MAAYIPVREAEAAHSSEYMHGFNLTNLRRWSPPGSPNRALVFKHTIKTPGNHDLTRDVVDVSLFGKHYDSDEELASPIDHDDMSFGSIDSDLEDDDENDFSDVLDYDSSFELERPCIQARAITLHRPNKVRIIEVSKPARPQSQTTTSTGEAIEMARSTSSHSRNSSSDTHTSYRDSMEYSTTNESDEVAPSLSPASSMSELVPPPRNLRRKTADKIPTSNPSDGVSTISSPKPGMSSFRGPAPVSFPSAPRSRPLLEAAADLSSASPTSKTFFLDSPRSMQKGFPTSSGQSSINSSPALRQSSDFSRRGDHSDISDSPAKKRGGLKKIASGLSLRSSANNVNRVPNKASPHVPASAFKDPELASIREPENLLDRARPMLSARLVPRGANERAPIIALPPSPGGDDDEHDDADVDEDSDDDFYGYTRSKQRRGSVGNAAAAASRAHVRQRYGMIR